MSRRYQLVVFDWDGTLMDSEARIVSCMQAAFSDLSLTPIDSAAVREIIGLELSRAIAALLTDANQELVDNLVERYRHHYLVADQTPSPLFAGAHETVLQLSEQEYFLAVATGKGRRGLDAVLEQSGMRELFHATRCADETYSKPHPDMLLQLIDELGVAAEDAVMVGDTDYDMQMAANADVDAVAVDYGVHPCERLMQHGPLVCLSAITELPEWLKE